MNVHFRILFQLIRRSSCIKKKSINKCMCMCGNVALLLFIFTSFEPMKFNYGICYQIQHIIYSFSLFFAHKKLERDSFKKFILNSKLFISSSQKNRELLYLFSPYIDLILDPVRFQSYGFQPNQLKLFFTLEIFYMACIFTSIFLNINLSQSVK